MIKKCFKDAIIAALHDEEIMIHKSYLKRLLINVNGKTLNRLQNKKGKYLTNTLNVLNIK